MKVSRKLIEVSLPLEKINVAAAKEKSIRHGHPSTLHLWWARRPLAAARAVLFAQLVDDPSGYIEDPTAAEKERQRLHHLIEQLVLWENSNSEPLLAMAREEMVKSWRRTCTDNADHPRAKDLFNPERLPAFHDPFAGGGAIPLEAQRLGLEAYASDLNPVAVLINKAMIEIPPKFSGCPPVNPDAKLMGESWVGARGLVDDVRYYAKWMRDEAERRIGDLYPKAVVTPDTARDRPDLKPYVGKSLTVIAWLWARTVRSPNPAFAHVHVPLVSSFMLSTKPGAAAYIQPLIAGDTYTFAVRHGRPDDLSKVESGTKLARANFTCLLSGAPISGDYIKAEATAGRMGVKLMAMVAEGAGRRVYLPPLPEHEAVAAVPRPDWVPDLTISGSTQYVGVQPYGLATFDRLFTARQLVALKELSDLVGEARSQISIDAAAREMRADYADAVATYLTLGLSRLTDICNALCRWEVTKTQVRNLFGRQAIPMIWDFAENNVFGDAAGAYTVSVGNMLKALGALPATGFGVASVEDARTQEISRDKVVSTDPPYYDNVPYADLSDFFYVWIRRSLKAVYPALFVTLSVPKSQELVAFAYRHDGKSQAERFFLDGMTQAMQALWSQAHPALPITIYYAFKQAETESPDGISSTGWETFLEAVIRAGFQVSATWPMRTELSNRMRGTDSNALASSIVLVCRRREEAAPTTSRRELVAALKAELPRALEQLQASNIAPVDLAQAAIGPGMSIFTRYARVLDAEGKALGVREALALINRTLDEALAEQEGDFDADSRWAVAWFEQFGFGEGDYGVAEQLSKSKATSVDGMVKAGIVNAAHGRVRLLQPTELDPAWDPSADIRRPTWQAVHQLVRAAEDGEVALARLVARLGPEAEKARELAYRLYVISERKRRTTEALWYNGLVQSWAEAQRLMAEGRSGEQISLFMEA